MSLVATEAQSQRFYLFHLCVARWQVFQNPVTNYMQICIAIAYPQYICSSLKFKKLALYIYKHCGPCHVLHNEFSTFAILLYILCAYIAARIRVQVYPIIKFYM